MATSKALEQQSQRKLRNLQVKINTYFTRMQNVYDSMVNLDTADQVDTFLSNASTIDIIRSDFVRTLDERNDLLSSGDEGGEPDYAAMLAFEDLYARVKFKYSQISSCHNTQNTTSDSYETKLASHNQGPKLPRLELMAFNGELENWPIFYETFKNSIHENINLSDTEKMQYLMGKLTGKAQTICQGFMPTAENYSVLWQTLVNKYNDKRVLAASYLEKILNLPSVIEDSSNSLDSFIDKYSSLVSSLKQLNLDSLEDFIFIHIGSKKIGLNLLKSFEIHHGCSAKLPSCSQFIEFIRNQAHILQRANNVVTAKQSSYGSRSSKAQTVSASRPNNNNIKIAKTFVINDQNKCLCCGNTDHFQLRSCKKFNSLSPTERFNIIKLNNGCVNCLSKDHTVRQCTSESRCTICLRSHNSLLHFHTDSNPEPRSNAATVKHSRQTRHKSATRVTSSASTSEPPAPALPPPCDDQSVSLCATMAQPSVVCERDGNNITAPIARPTSAGRTVLLGTAQCNVIDAAGNKHIVRILVDSASQRDLITIKCCKKLNLQLFPSPTKYVYGVGDHTNPVEGYTQITLLSRLDNSIRFTIQPLVTRRITSELPSAKIDNDSLEYLSYIPLADLSYSVPSDIDLLVGSDFFARIIRPNIITRKIDEPVAVETLLGFIVYGQAPIADSDADIRTYCTLDGGSSLDKAVTRFFELEDVPSANILTPEEQECERFYSDTTSRDNSGRYIVALPFKDDPVKLGDSLQATTRRYLSLERKLLANKEIKIEYDKNFEEYLEKGYLMPVNNKDTTFCKHYVIPHHGVLRPDKSSTKLRVVLDASMKTSSGLALNDLLHTGPNLQNDLFKIILNFRLFPVAISADIRQMYLQILVREEDRRFQMMLYRENCDQPLRLYEMTRVPFGLCSSPFLAIRTVRQLVADEGGRFPAAAPVAERDMYMDDLATSCGTTAEGIGISRELIELFHAGGFDLIKFSSNSPEVMKSISPSSRVSSDVEFSPDDSLKILGLRWIPAEDVFTFTVNVRDGECTKRSILSTVARLWDLMGFVAPVTTLVKLIIQYLWANNFDWDQKPPQNIISRWNQIKSELPVLRNIKIPRHVGFEPHCVVTILGFADASERAYGGVVYIHVFYPNENKYVINLICAKSRVAPIRTVSLARLELCGNLILAKLIRLAIDTYSQRIKISNVYAFTDSMVALAWIKASASRWQTFVANRVAKIQELLSPSHFCFIPGKENPADCLSRGLTPEQLSLHPLWFQGPGFARQPVSQWPVTEFDPTDVDAPESKSPVLVTNERDKTEPPLLISLALRVSNWSKLIRIVVYILKFLGKVPKKFEYTHLEYAELLIVKHLQNFYFFDEFDKIKNNKPLSPAFQKLKAFVHNDIFRVGGRLSNADMPYDSQHPILLPSRDHIVNLIIDHYHRKYLHTGPQLLLSLLRQKFWILSARSIVRKRVQLCNICFKTRPKNEFPIMADLPAARVQEAKAFFHTGIDYAGPLRVIPFRKRGVRSQKAYICFFVCLVTKAVHIELSSDLSTESFLNSFKRFISRRGPIKYIYTDCGTNFIGAKSSLSEMYKLTSSKDYLDKLDSELLSNKIEWKFNPPASPHFGGIWEGNIRSVKMHLQKVVGSQLLTVEEMTTLLTQIEAILNTRPLSVLSSDPSEPLALTPAHFLTLTPLKYLPSETVSENISIIDRKRIVDSLMQSFWRRWKLEYLNTLQGRTKWLKNTTQIKEGTIVLLHSENSPPLDWPLGIIEKIFPGRDGIVRVVNVRTRSGVYRRPVVKVYPLPNQ